MVDRSGMAWVGEGVVPDGVVDGSVMEWIGGGGEVPGGVVDGSVMEWIGRGVVPRAARGWLLGRAVVNLQINIVNM